MSSASAPDRPPGFIHVDCDGLWAVRSCYEPQVPSFPAKGDRFWHEGVPACLDLLQARRLPGTFFVVATDLTWGDHAALTREITAAGHEIACHGRTHVMALRRSLPELMRDEIVAAREQIGAVTGEAPRGFRSPGFSFSRALLPHLKEAGYSYDSSRFVSPLGPPLRWVRRWLSRRSASRQAPYGGLAEAFAPRGPHALPGSEILELPVSLTPWRLPAHASFALLKSGDAFRRVLAWHARRRLPFVWLIHLIDVCDTRELDLPVPRWSQRAFRQSGEDKRARLGQMLDWVGELFDVQRTDRWVDSERSRLAEARDGRGAA